MAHSEPYIPDTPPFHTEPDGFRCWENGKDKYICASPSGTTYRGDLTGVALFIARERNQRDRNR